MKFINTGENIKKYDAALALCQLSRNSKKQYKIDINRGHVRGLNGSVIGSVKSSPYKIIAIYNSTFYLHRFIYEYCYGEISDDLQIDHIDRDKLNNSIHNLRLVTRSENLKNRIFS